jgi:hypothetical protein
MADTEPKGWVPPYISFSSLSGLLDRMQDDGGAPPMIDRSYLSSFSGGYQSQVLAALKSLGLIKDNGTVTERLTGLVEANGRDERVPIIADMLKQYYPEPVRLGTTRATQGQLEDAFRQYGISGDTLRKAIAFYLAACEFAGIPTSGNFRVPRVAAGEGRKGRKQRQRSSSTGNEPDFQSEQQSSHTDDAWQDEIDPAILAWLKRIPAREEDWPPEEREAWLTVLKAIFGGIYRGE